MTSRKVALLLAASVFLTGATGAFLGSMTPTYAITGIDELRDVNENHWAYEALRDLVEKYDVIEGYPDNTFRGERAATRWELAAALNALIKSVGRDLARLGAEKADRADLERLARLQEEFRAELNALQARTDALEARAAAIEAKNEEQDNRLTLLEKTQLHGDFSVGLLADMSGSGVNAPVGDNGDGIIGGISALGRLRLTLDVPVRDDVEDSLIGRGDVHARLIAAFGRISPQAAEGGNGGAWGTFTGYSRIAGDASSDNEGFNTSFTPLAANGGSNLRSNLYVENMHYKQHLKSGIPLLTDWMLGNGSDDADWATTGDLYVGVVPWRYLYDKSPYRGNELTQFQNTAFVNIPGVPVNQNQPMIAYQWHQQLGSENLSLDFTTGVGSINIGDVMDGFNLTYEGRLNYVFGNLPGSVYAGGYHAWGFGGSGAENYLVETGGAGIASLNRRLTDLDSKPGDIDAILGFYTGWNQEWFEGIGTTFNYAFNPNSSNLLLTYTSLDQTTGASRTLLNENIATSLKHAITGALHIPTSALGFRDNDAIGLAYGVLKLHSEGVNSPGGNGADNAWAHVAEIYYRWQATDSISIVPSVQFIGNRLGVDQNGGTVVIGLRSNYVF